MRRRKLRTLNCGIAPLAPCSLAMLKSNQIGCRCRWQGMKLRASSQHLDSAGNQLGILDAYTYKHCLDTTAASTTQSAYY